MPDLLEWESEPDADWQTCLELKRQVALTVGDYPAFLYFGLFEILGNQVFCNSVLSFKDAFAYCVSGCQIDELAKRYKLFERPLRRYETEIMMQSLVYARLIESVRIEALEDGLFLIWFKPVKTFFHAVRISGMDAAFWN